MIAKSVLGLVGSRRLLQSIPLLTVTGSLLFSCRRTNAGQNALETPMEKPKLIVFDLDYTLWPFWVDTHVDAPFNKKSNGKIYDAHGKHVKHFPDVPDILRTLHSEGYTLAIASRTSYTKEARDLVRLFDWEQYLTYKEIYPGSKVTHFNKFHQQSGIPYSSMLFFDDEHRNIVDTQKMGVCAIFTPDGVTSALVTSGLQEFAQRKKAKSPHHSDL